MKADAAGTVREVNERLWTGIDKCRALVSDCKSALEDGTGEPSIFGWAEAGRSSLPEQNGLDQDPQSRD